MRHARPFGTGQADVGHATFDPCALQRDSRSRVPQTTVWVLRAIAAIQGAPLMPVLPIGTGRLALAFSVVSYDHAIRCPIMPFCFFIRFFSHPHILWIKFNPP